MNEPNIILNNLVGQCVFDISFKLEIQTLEIYFTDGSMLTVWSHDECLNMEYRFPNGIDKILL
jgi:hypothetical protein